MTFSLLSTSGAGGLKLLFLAGDGLTLMRMNHLLASEPDVWLDQTPVIVPIQGEHPHGFGHGLHAQYRMYKRFLMKLAAEIDNPQILEDWGISDLNVHRFFILNVVTPACAEYVIELCRDPLAPDYDDPDPLLTAASANIDFAWLLNCLHNCCFWALDFLQSVRGNDSHGLDVLWREFFSTAHSGTANKTQYVGMAILRVFWGQALSSDLSALYHKIRTIPTGTHDGCGVGWDMPCEDLNGAIRSHVDTRVSEKQITNFVADWALVEAVQAQMRRLLFGNRAERHWRGRDASVDVETLKTFFRDKIGATWTQATRANTTPHVLQGPDRGVSPWREVRDVMARTGRDAPHEYIQRYVAEMTPFFQWSP